MEEPTATGTVTVTNPQGLHARPATRFAEVAGRYEAKIEVIRGGDRLNAKSILDILTLAAEQGTQLCIEATGRDAVQALRALVELVEGGFTLEKSSKQKKETMEQDQPDG